jgi:alginate O-acetyltransferase complex protein AlgI
MQFTTYQFIFAFAPAVIVIYWLIPARYRYVWLLAASYIFYAFWDWRFSGLMLLTTYVDYTAGRQIHKALLQAKSRARIWLLMSEIVNLGLLAYFKYSSFFVGIAENILDRSSFDAIYVILPLGISFYTFKSLSYTFDIYKSRCKPTTSFLHYAAFVSFFPELLAGPIDRYKDLAPQLESPQPGLTNENLNLGLFFCALGLVKKILIADRIAYYSAPLWSDIIHLSTFEAWIATFAYSIQIYFDFAGYSLIALGLGFLLGLKLPQNFNSPYRSKDISDFWRRWHMSLSFWFRDYVFFNIGGLNLTSRWVALFLTMALCGFWHGAAWTFLIWGSYHGLLLIIHHLLREHKKRWKGGWLSIIGTFFLVSIGWVIFNTTTLHNAGLMFTKMFGFLLISPSNALDKGIESVEIYKSAIPNQLFVLMLIGFVWAVFVPNLYEYAVTQKKVPSLFITALVGFLAAVAVILVSDSNPFLYAQF